MQKTKNGKALLVESSSFSSKMYKNLTHDPEYKPLVESATKVWIKQNLSKLDESVRKEYSKLEEGIVNGTVINNVIQNLKEKGLTPPTLWQFPISRVNTIEEPNINGRVYSDSLWENVLNKQRDVWQGGSGLADHPEDDGHFMDQSIVWLDGLKENGIVYGIGALVGEGGKLAEQIISVGGRVGFSTAGYGEVLAEGVVDADTYEIERFADLVLNPSQGVYGDSNDRIGGKPMTNENKENTMKKTVNESVKAKSLLEDEEVEDQNEEAEDQNTEDEEGSEEAETEEGSEEETSEEEGSEEEGSEEGDEPEEEGSEEESEEEGESEESEEGEGDEEGDEETLSESLIVKYYMKKITEQAKRPGREWQEKIHALETIITKLKKENLSEKSKKAINSKVNIIIESTMKETEKVIQCGYDAKELCEKIGISDIKKLSGIQTKVEEYASLEECLAKANKEAAKYKKLFESKEEAFTAHAKEAFEVETALEESQKRVSHLREKVKSQKEEIDTLTRQYENAKARIAKLREKNDTLSELLAESDKTNKVLTRKAGATTKELRTYKVAEARQQREAAEFRRATTDMTNRVVEDSDIFKETGSINDFLEQIDGLDESSKKAVRNSKTLQEAQSKALFANPLLNERAEARRARINTPRQDDSISSLAEMFK